MNSLLYLAMIWIAVFIANVLARKSKLTPVLWFLFLGSLLSNTNLIPSHADEFIHGLATLGIIVIMFSLGFEESTSAFLKSIRKSWGIAFFGALAPFFAAYLIADYYWGNTNIALICGLTMTATAVSLTMVSLKSEGLGQSPVAMRIMTSAVLDDIASLALVAIVVPIAAGEGPANALDIAFISLKAVAFFVLVTVLGGILFPHDLKGWLRKIPFIGTFGFRHLLLFGQHSTLTVLLLAVLVGLLAHEFGFHPAVGAYMAGLILREEYFDGGSKDSSYTETKRIVDNVAFSWIGPVFFVELGAQILFDWDILLSVMPEIITLTVALFIAQVTSASLAARYTAGMAWPSSVLVGFGMLGRAELAFVVMDIAYVQNKILTTEAFYTLMATAFFLNIAVPVTIALWKPVYERDARRAQ